MGRPPIGMLYAIPKCACGDAQLVHADSAQEHHGECIVTGCPCIKFTWTPNFEIIRVGNPPSFAHYYYGYADNGIPIIGGRVTPPSYPTEIRLTRLNKPSVSEK